MSMYSCTVCNEPRCEHVIEEMYELAARIEKLEHQLGRSCDFCEKAELKLKQHNFILQGRDETITTQAARIEELEAREEYSKKYILEYKRSYDKLREALEKINTHGVYSGAYYDEYVKHIKKVSYNALKESRESEPEGRDG